MTQPHSLLDSVLADPGDAIARKKYCDSLATTSDPANTARSAILDAQCLLACKTANDAVGVKLTPTLQGAFQKFADKWFGEGLGFVQNWWNYDSGIEVSVAHYLAMDEVKLPFAPIQAIYLCSKNYFSESDGAHRDEAKSEYIQLAKRPSLRYWLSLSLVEKGIPGDCFVKLIKSPHLVHLRRLYAYECPLGDESVQAISSASNLKSLRHLNLNSLGDDDQPTDAALEALAQSRFIRQLESIYLQGGFSDKGVSALAASPNLQNVQSLHLHGGLTGASMVSLTSSSYLEKVTDLNLGWFNQVMDDSGVTALIAWPNLSQVTSLGLGATGITADGLRRLATCASIGSLESLDLSHNKMNDESGLSALVDSPYLERAKTINLWDVSPISPRMRKKLVRKFGSRLTLIPAERG